MDERIRLAVSDGIARLTLAAPERRNAIDLAFCEQWAALTDTCAKRADVRLILIAAEGGLFSVGGDIGAFAAQGEALGPYIEACVAAFHAGIRALVDAPAPVLLALNGTAAGGAFSLVCMADMAIAKRSAKLVSGYTQSGLTPDGGLSWLLPLRVGPSRAFEIMATNRPIAAEEAERLGLVARVIDDDAFEQAVEDSAARLAAMPPEVLADLKRLVRDGHRRSLAEQIDAEMAAMIRRGGMADTQQRLRAFLAKR